MHSYGIELPTPGGTLLTPVLRSGGTPVTQDDGPRAAQPAQMLGGHLLREMTGRFNANAAEGITSQRSLYAVIRLQAETGTRPVVDIAHDTLTYHLSIAQGSS